VQVAISHINGSNCTGLDEIAARGKVTLVRARSGRWC